MRPRVNRYGVINAYLSADEAKRLRQLALIVQIPVSRLARMWIVEGMRRLEEDISE